MPCSLQQMPVGTFEIGKRDGSTFTLMGYVYTEHPSANEYVYYYAMLGSYTLPCSISVGEEFCFVATTELNNADITSVRKFTMWLDDNSINYTEQRINETYHSTWT